MPPETEPLILVTADLHYGARREGDRAVEALAAHVRGTVAAALVIVGDIATSPDKIAACLDLFQGFDGLKAAVPGNHDIWVRRGSGGGDGPSDSWELYERTLPEVFRGHGFHPLHLGPARVDGVTLVGTMGWYDYSFRDDIGIGLESYRSKTYPGDPLPMWNDALLARFDMSDEELTALLVDRMGEHLRALPVDERVMVFSHHLATRRLLIRPRLMVPRRWRFANAFLGSERLSEVIEASGKVAQVFCGHAHFTRSHHSRATRYAVIGSDYESKQLVRATPARVVSRQMFG